MLRKLGIFLIFNLILIGLFASGYQINEHGAKAMAMGGAFTALADDPSAVYFNPAGLSQLSGTQFMGGFTLIAPKSTFRGPSPEITEYEMEDQMFNPINFYISHQINENLFLGMGINNPYGLGTKWDEDWVGKSTAIDTEIKTFFYSPTLTWKFNDKFSIGGGPLFAHGDVTIEKFVANESLNAFDADPYISLEGDAKSAWGFSAGFMYKPNEKFQLGLAYKSEVTFEYEGEATVEAPSQFNGLLPSGDIKAETTTPMNVVLGAAFFPTEELTLTADYQYVGWSSYDKLEIEFLDFTDEEGNPTIQSSKRDYDDCYIIRFGAEYQYKPCLALRTGILYDKNPAQDELLEPTLPDTDRIGLNAGLGYKINEKFTLDLAYLFLRGDERKIDNSEVSYTSGGDSFLNGVYNTTVHLIGINFSYKLK